MNYKYINTVRILIVGFCASLVFLVSLCGAASTDPSRPNVVLIVCDDLNDYVEGFGGHPQAKTSHLAGLGKSGVRFTRAYSNVPVCAPSFATFLLKNSYNL